ncbi:MAG: protein kinase domain-containing protein [Ruminococcus sp.]
MDKDKLIGTRLDGRYELTELVGEGGMADVYRAVDVLDNRVVAVKILKQEYSESEEFQRRFRDESKAIAMMSHPNIVKIYDMGFSDKMQYIVMEYIDGITLKDYIDSEHVLNWKDAVHFVIQILRALQRPQPWHCSPDIKPQNIMLLTDGTIKVMDFGIAKFAREESRTATDQAIGTVHYISPEQARGDVTDAKSDLYSVGVMFYEMLTGRKPFDTDNPVSIAVMHMQNVAVRPRDINPNIPSGLEEIIMHAMEKDSAKRYQTAADMIRDIEAFKANNQIIFGYYNAPEQTQYFTPPEENRNRTPQRRNGYDSGSRPDYYENNYRGKRAGAGTVQVAGRSDSDCRDHRCGRCGSNRDLPAGGTGTNGSSGSTDEVPKVIGMNYDDAVLNYPNIEFEVAEQEYTDKYEENIIYKQNVEAGQFVKKNKDGKIELAVAVSKGIQKVQIPDLTNYTAQEAEDALKALGLTAEQKKTQSTSEKTSRQTTSSAPNRARMKRLP